LWVRAPPDAVSVLRTLGRRMISADFKGTQFAGDETNNPGFPKTD